MGRIRRGRGVHRDGLNKMREINITGIRFGRCVAQSKTETKSGGQRLWNCLCDCGRIFLALSCNLRSGDTKSCGCYNSDSLRDRNFKHGKSDVPEFAVWWMMIQRCENPKADSYQFYGARGIHVCERWKASFSNFLADMGSRPSKAHSIDRKDNDLGYFPTNCRWVTADVQNSNTRRTRHIEFHGKRMTHSQFCREYNIPRTTFRRLHNEFGISADLILLKFNKTP